MDVKTVKSEIILNAPRIKQLGEWPDHVDEASLVSRIPDPSSISSTAPGFDAGVACCLDLIPRDKQRLSAILHGAYTEEAVEQARVEIELIEEAYQWYTGEFGDLASCGAWDPDCIWQEAADAETCWWLAACSVCSEGAVDGDELILQINMFKDCFVDDKTNPMDPYHDPLRLKAAYDEFQKIRGAFHIIDNIPVATKDGGMQAAYILGYDLAIQFAYGTWFVGTYHESLGLPDDYPWTNRKDEKDRPKSGPVFGSKQFVKCATFYELADTLRIARKHLDVSEGE